MYTIKITVENETGPDIFENVEGASIGEKGELIIIIESDKRSMIYNKEKWRKFSIVRKEDK